MGKPRAILKVTKKFSDNDTQLQHAKLSKTVKFKATEKIKVIKSTFAKVCTFESPKKKVFV
jgi:hypothetical protein